MAECSVLRPREKPIGNTTHRWPSVPKTRTRTHGETHIEEAALRTASTKGGGRLRRPPPFVDSFMDGCVEAGEAADAAETHVNVRKTCTCMHTLRATSDPQGHHGRAQSTGRADKALFCVFMKTKKTRSARTIILPGVSRRDLCYASGNEQFRF